LIPVKVKFPLTRVIVIKLQEILAVLRRQESSKIKRLLNNTTQTNLTGCFEKTGKFQDRETPK